MQGHITKRTTDTLSSAFGLACEYSRNSLLPSARLGTFCGREVCDSARLGRKRFRSRTWEDTKGLHCKYPGELHTIPYNFVIRNCMELSRRLFLISLGAADFVTYDQREVFFPTPFCQENVIIWKQNRHDRVGRPKPAKIKGFSSSISEASFVSIWSKIRFLGCR